jgi:SAM-dependent methyltransferase
MNDFYTQMVRRYRENDLPWNTELPPPEVIEMANKLPPGRLLDLGCGLGRACIYLAQNGWICDGVDFIPEAVERAKALAEAAGVTQRTNFYLSSVANLEFLQPYYDYALDVGCLHRQPTEVKQLYVRHLVRLIRPDGYYMLFGRTQDEEQPGQTWLSEAGVYRLFEKDFVVERYEKGTTNFGGELTTSAWVWLRKN